VVQTALFPQALQGSVPIRLPIGLDQLLERLLEVFFLVGREFLDRDAGRTAAPAPSVPKNSRRPREP
jgi:hypothetical protein